MPQPSERDSKDDYKQGNARLVALRVLNQVLNEGAYANIALNKELLNTKTLSDLDRRFATELVYGTLKAKGTLDWIIARNVSRTLKKISPVILNILRLGVFQIYFLERIPASAACNEAVSLAKAFGHEGTGKFVNAVLRSSVRSLDTCQYPTMAENPKLHLALAYQHPEWLMGKWLKRFGEEATIKLCEYDNTARPLTLRVNTLTTTRKQLLEQLLAEGLVAVPSDWSPDGIVCTQLPSLQELFQKHGREIYVQDESSMLVAPIVNPQPGQIVIDVCSAPGGKTTHLAQLMRNQGKIIATDIHAHKLNLIRENAARLGITIIDARERDGVVTVPEWKRLADCVLVDAPCSGLGVLGRRAEARWTKDPDEFKKLPALQLAILKNAAGYVKNGGTLVYSTCTLEKAENQGVIATFLAEEVNFAFKGFQHPRTGETIEELQILPQQDGIDGFYICALQRKA
ncbi:MAG: 16S rRNA (cytosine(967)-C(5))-methyltransferase RsmB [Acidaminococcaceae bacterium]